MTETIQVETHDDHHPTEKTYWIVFLSLLIITAAEVALSYVGLEGKALVIPLLLMMAVKFVIVTGAFMHLYFDHKSGFGKLFWAFFAGGLIVALLVFSAILATFRFQI